jgi:beta-aspartyl-peptidase (threonine type)
MKPAGEQARERKGMSLQRSRRVHPGIIVHGGAGRKLDMRAHRRGVRRAALAGHKVLLAGGSALDAVVAAVVDMEDDATFNCGTGSALTMAGTAEMDAAVMTDDLRCGAVGALERVRNPILVARRVMETTDHVFLVGPGALRFARRMGFRPYDPVVDHRRRQYREMLERLNRGRHPPYLPHLTSTAAEMGLGTVGAVARDERGRLAAATSTGAMMLRLPGRVGDSPLIGAGTYADAYGAVSATGHGEEIIRLVWAARAAQLMRQMTAPRAVRLAVELATRNGCRGGLIAVDRRGRVGYGFNTRSMSWAHAGRSGLEVF